MNVDQEPCPVCGELHTRGIYEKRPDSNVMFPRDIECNCGAKLRWSVPIFKATNSGYILRQLRVDEKLFV